MHNLHAIIGKRSEISEDRGFTGPGCTVDLPNDLVMIPVNDAFYEAKCGEQSSLVVETFKFLPKEGNVAVHRFTIFADYFQFIVQDEDSKDDFGALWNDAAVAVMVAAGETALSLGTLRNVDVSVELHIVDAPPRIELIDFDHAVEGAFTSPTGKIAVMGCTEFFPDASRFEVPPGSYRFIYLVSGVRTIKTEWDPADDLYSLYIWPEALRELQLLKQWKPARLDDGS